ncbi:hypothetical protein JG688_00015064 [Phytophthora aleatoria]|uniref:Uncharacterized protein n=1 Tax=Phytophthora aleatoria TaxID=2496075 RepID=A0A8J5LZV1_9STRA|nr:hypothetical protein JG688_00015064 [Phytophthora aleatoria]
MDGDVEPAHQPPLDEMGTDDMRLLSRQGQESSDAQLPGMPHSTSPQRSYEQLAAAVLNRASVSPHHEDYAQLADALRNLTPEIHTQDISNSGFPSYAQLNALLRNLTPGTLPQETTTDGFPAYSHLAQALRGLSPPPLSTENNTAGFPTNAQLSTALRVLPATSRSRCARVTRDPRYAALGTLIQFVDFPRHALAERLHRCEAML